MFKKATKQQARLRMALHGPSGAGKTYTALQIAAHLAAARGGRVALLDTEHGSASKYSDAFDFDVVEVADNYSPDRVVEVLNEAAKHGYSVLVIDSMTHFWNGAGGFLELVDREVANMKARGGKPDSFAAWKVVDPVYRRMVQAMLSAPLDVIVTLRAKTEYQKVEGNNGRTSIQKVGLAPEMRDNFQYEMDVEGMLSIDHALVIGKTRCATLDGAIFQKPGKDVADALYAWLSTGAAPAVIEPPAPVTRAEAEAALVAALVGADVAAEDVATFLDSLEAKASGDWRKVQGWIAASPAAKLQKGIADARQGGK